jgi:nitroimidazol reductase NimA-like FMN-containing flavoprotein (pyridoxamine 5'-phosphate oxidase superfamily)
MTDSGSGPGGGRGSAVYGRVGVVADGEPVILPVNDVVHRRSIAFRTAGGTKSSWPTVAFEVDGGGRRSDGWSVLVVGPAEEIRDGGDRREVEALGLQPWAPGAKLHWVRIVPRRVSGRRLPAPARDRREAP